MSAPARPEDATLVRSARELFAREASKVMPEVAAAVMAQLTDLVDQIGNAREMQDRRDAWLAFQKAQKAWVDGTVKAWQRAVNPPTATARVRLESVSFELLGDEVVENKIIASRLALALLDRITWELNDLRLRVQQLEGTTELESHDVFRPEVLAQLCVEQWTAAGLSRETWLLAQDVVREQFKDKLVGAYKAVNAFLIERGVMPEIDLRHKVRRVESAAPRTRAAENPEASDSAPGAVGSDSRMRQMGGGSGGAGGGGGGNSASGERRGRGSSRGGSGASDAGGGGSAGGAQGGFGSGGYGGGGGGPRAGGAGANGASASGNNSAGDGGSWADDEPGLHTRAAGETRMETSSTPLARARMRAQGVIGNLRRMLNERVPAFDATRAQQPSGALATAMDHTRSVDNAEEYAPGAAVDNASVERIAGSLRARTQQLKQKASSQTEKATIEIVALMFQAILAEERIPAGVRVWFARLQMPVLRVALAEPEFFDSLQHPARQLIDRMGACVLGFDAAAISGGALEGEIRRIVQVIEQYPDTGRRVFELVYDEFQKFLARFLTEQGPHHKLVSVAQQIEQKETLAIQYTIELRNMLKDVPVSDAIRDFLFKTWTEVLAVASMKHGAKHEDTATLKRTAADLVWAASAKPNRADRARVIQDLPSLLQRLRTGMTLLGLPQETQEQHIKSVSDTLAEAFMSRTGAIPQARIEAMAKRLANLEEYFSDDDVGDLPLDAESIEMISGIDASAITVIADGGSKPSEAMLAWANEIQAGTWFRLDHNGRVSNVQFAWRSARGQLQLFASSDGRSFLFQKGRLAAYLQAGLLTPIEEEALTVRATRDALKKLDANPERLLH